MTWWRDAVFYQIYPRSFQDSDGDGVGDLDGITRRLDHLSWLGVDGVWLSPIYPSPGDDCGYDVADHADVDELFGGLDAFDRFLDAAHDRGLRVVLDLVPNHTSDRHAWFERSRSSRDDAYRDWYIWADPAPGGGPPNNWLSAFGGPAWTFDERTGQYYLHSFLASQPDLNWRNPAVVEATEDVMRFWLDRGVDGFRIDVVYRLVKDELLRDNPPIPGADPALGEKAQDRRHSMNQPETHEMCRRFRRLLDSYDHAPVAVGEVTVLDPEVVASFYGQEDELHLAFNFHFCYRDWDPYGFTGAILDHEAALGQGNWPCWVLSNHDVPRHAARFGPHRARAAAVLLLTLRGTPFLYQGEEIGMTGCRTTDAVDPVGRDVCRTPMQWDDSPNAGFCAPDVTPWLPVCDDGLTVASQRDDPASLLHLYRSLIALRREVPALRSGSWRLLDSAPGVVAYEREHGDSLARVAVNFTEEPRPLLASDFEVTLTTHGIVNDVLPPDAAAVLLPSR